MKRVIRYLLEPLLEQLSEPLSALEPLAGTLLPSPFELWNPFQRTLPVREPLPAPFWHTSSRPFQRWNPFQRPFQQPSSTPPPDAWFA